MRLRVGGRVAHTSNPTHTSGAPFMAQSYRDMIGAFAHQREPDKIPSCHWASYEDNKQANSTSSPSAATAASLTSNTPRTGGPHLKSEGTHPWIVSIN
jgi:hypothetical protein